MRTQTLAVLALAAVIAAGCGSDASSESDSGKSTSATKAATFSQCMRDHGISAFPDPDPSGELTLDGVVNGSSIDPDAPAWQAAIDACRDLQPAGFTGHERTAEEQDLALVFARCVRDHGVTDFPDPVKGEPLINTNHIPSANRPGGMDILNAATHACGREAEAAMGQ